MMGERTVLQEALFYSFNLDRHVPMDHLLRSVDRFVDLSGVRQHLEPYYSRIGRPSVDPELMVRMLIVGYCFGIRSERRLCDEVHLNLGYRWFCRLSLDAAVPDHSTFSKARHTEMPPNACMDNPYRHVSNLFRQFPALRPEGMRFFDEAPTSMTAWPPVALI